jgi:DNA-binding transcriptional ArsR family regulator
MPGPHPDDLELVNVLDALSDPVRLQIVEALDAEAGEMTCSDFELGVAKSTASHHFRVLREAGVLEVRDEGTRRFNRLRRDDLDTRFPGLLDSILSAARTPQRHRRSAAAARR